MLARYPTISERCGEGSTAAGALEAGMCEQACVIYIKYHCVSLIPLDNSRGISTYHTCRNPPKPLDSCTKRPNRLPQKTTILRDYLIAASALRLVVRYIND